MGDCAEGILQCAEVGEAEFPGVGFLGGVREDGGFVAGVGLVHVVGDVCQALDGGEVEGEIMELEVE